MRTSGLPPHRSCVGCERRKRNGRYARFGFAESANRSFAPPFRTGISEMREELIDGLKLDPLRHGIRKHASPSGELSEGTLCARLREPNSEFIIIISLCSRSEERRVGKGVDLGGRRIIKKKTPH